MSKLRLLIFYTIMFPLFVIVVLLSIVLVITYSLLYRFITGHDETKLIRWLEVTANRYTLFCRRFSRIQDPEAWDILKK